MTLRFKLNVLLAALVGNGLFIWWGRETFMPLGLVWVSAVLLGILLLVLAAILQAFTKSRVDPSARLTIRMSVVSALVCFALLPSVPYLKKQHRVDHDSARARAEQLVPALQEYFDANGAFPARLDAVAGAEPLPWLLREGDAYRASGAGYVIQIRHPGHPFAADERRHNETRWRLTQ
ncbi:MAG TPA: hypothetical protein PKE12_12745 [Kiritimatiellia bacterium]|nr:hypothetical protein [Kiritimatiellia bacterium]